MLGGDALENLLGVGLIGGPLGLEKATSESVLCVHAVIGCRHALQGLKRRNEVALLDE